jgi:tRNA-dihydrouridine synthase
MQLLGADPDLLAEAARRLEDAGADGIDLNMGCPVPKIVAKGQGAALMRDPLAAAVVLRTLRKAVRGRLSIKIRSGWDERTVNAVEIARLAESEGVDGVTVHPRTRAQQYTGRAPWEIIAAVVAAVRVPVTGNGDVRGVGDARADPETRAAVVRRHTDLIEAHLPPRPALVQLKKHLAWYSAGLPGSAALRPRLFAAASAAEVRDLFWTLWTA